MSRIVSTCPAISGKPSTPRENSRRQGYMFSSLPERNPIISLTALRPFRRAIISSTSRKVPGTAILRAIYPISVYSCPGNPEPIMRAVLSSSHSEILRTISSPDVENPSSSSMSRPRWVVHFSRTCARMRSKPVLTSKSDGYTVPIYVMFVLAETIHLLPCGQTRRQQTAPAQADILLLAPEYREMHVTFRIGLEVFEQRSEVCAGLCQRVVQCCVVHQLAETAVCGVE